MTGEPSSIPKKKWYYKLWFVIIMLLAVGPFGFPLLWKSSDFSKGMKWALTILFTAITITCFWGLIETIRFALKQFQELQSAM